MNHHFNENTLSITDFIKQNYWGEDFDVPEDKIFKEKDFLIEKGPSTVENFIKVNCRMNRDTSVFFKHDGIMSFNINQKTMDYIFCQGIMNAIQNGIDTTFEFEQLESVNTYNSKAFINLLEQIKSKKSYLKRNKDKKFLICYFSVSIAMMQEINSIRIKVYPRYAFLDNPKDEFDYKISKEFFFTTYLSMKSAINLTNFIVSK